MTIGFEDQIRDVLARQAAAMTPPNVQPDELLPRPAAHTDRPARRLRRTWPAVAAAAAVVVALVGAVLLRDDPKTPTTTANQGDGVAGTSTTMPPPGPEAAFAFETPQVRLEADAITIEVAGLTFTPEQSVDVNSDPGGADYTTLELSWLEHDVEMRIYLYFASDGSDWWVSEVRTYDGAAAGEWITSVGERFRSPLGAAYEGDVDLGGLQIQGMRLEAFRSP